MILLVHNVRLDRGVIGLIVAGFDVRLAVTFLIERIESWKVSEGGKADEVVLILLLIRPNRPMVDWTREKDETSDFYIVSIQFTRSRDMLCA